MLGCAHCKVGLFLDYWSNCARILSSKSTTHTESPSNSSEMFRGPEPALSVSHTVIKTAIRDWAFKQNEKRWQSLNMCQKTRELVTGGCRRRERDLLALPRQTLRLVIGIVTGHAPV